MGTFGITNFANDSALDWLADFNSRRSIAKLEKQLTHFIQTNSDEPEALAAAELIAAISGYPSDDLEVDLETWCDKQRKKLTPELRTLAHTAVTKIVTDSELRALWLETEDFPRWEALQRELLTRLSNAPTDIKERRPPAVEIFLPTDPMEPLRYRVGSLPPPSDQLQPTSVSLCLTDDTTAAEVDAFVTWSHNFPSSQVGLNDRSIPRGKSAPEQLLSRFTGTKSLTVHLEKSKSIEPLAALTDLEELQLRFIKKVARPLASITKLPNLRALSLVYPNPKLLDLNDLPNLNSLSLDSSHFTYPEQILQPSLKLDPPLTLPTLPSTLNQLTLSCTHITTLEPIAHTPNLRSLELRGVITETPELDLSSHTNLRALEAICTRGLHRIKPPPSLRVLQLLQNHDLTTHITVPMPELLMLWLDADTLTNPLPPNYPWPQLRHLSLRGSLTPAHLETFRNAPQLQVADLTPTNSLPTLDALHSVQYLNVYDLADTQSLQHIATLPHLKLLCLAFDFKQELDLTLDDFACFKDHPSLEAMSVLGSFNAEFETQLLEFLGLERATFAKLQPTLRALDELVREALV